MWKTSHLWDQQKCWPGSDWVTFLSLVCICWLAPQIPPMYGSIKGNLIRLQAPTVIQSTLLPVLGWNTKISLAHSLFKKSGLGGKLELDPKWNQEKTSYFVYFLFSMWTQHHLFLRRIYICFVHLFVAFGGKHVPLRHKGKRLSLCASQQLSHQFESVTVGLWPPGRVPWIPSTGINSGMSFTTSW